MDRYTKLAVSAFIFSAAFAPSASAAAVFIGAGSYTGLTVGAQTSGIFADTVHFFHEGDPASTPSEPPESAMLGQPDGSSKDLDGGGATLGIPSGPFGSVDLPFTLNAAADLILFGGTKTIGDINPPPDQLQQVMFGYGTPVDGNGDGVADNTTGVGSLIQHETFVVFPWVNSGEGQNVLIYDLDGNYSGPATDLFFAFDDISLINIDPLRRGDLDIDALMLVADPPEPVPVPAMVWPFALLVAAGIWMARRAKR